MRQRIDYQEVSSGAFRVMLGMENYVRQCGLEYSLIELVNLVSAIITINGWNRLALSFHTEAGTYQPPAK